MCAILQDAKFDLVLSTSIQHIKLFSTQGTKILLNSESFLMQMLLII